MIEPHPEKFLSARHLTAVLLFCLLIPFSWRWLYFHQKVPVNGNVLREVYPNWRVTHNLLRQGRWPLWNPYRDMGEPLLADPKTMAAYPLSWILAETDSFSKFLQIWFLFHTLLASYFAGALCFRWFHHRPGALMSALVVGFNGFFMAHGPYLNLFASVAWLPAILYFHSKKSWQALGFCLAMQWLSGYPPFCLLTLLALVISRWGLKEGSWPVLFAAGLTAAGLSAYQWLPFLELLRHSTRTLLLDSRAILEFSIVPKDMLKELFWPGWIWMNPQINGDPAVVSFYFGALAAPLAVWAAYRGKRKERVLALSTLAALLLCLGAALPGYRSFFLLHVFRFPATWLLLVAIGMSLLAGAGIALIQNRRTAWILIGIMTLDLLIFAQAPIVGWFQPDYLKDPPPLAQRLTQGPFPTRLYHSPIVEDAWAGMPLRTPGDYLLMKEWLSPSSVAGWGGREANSYQVLRLQRVEAYLDRIGREGPRSPLLAWAGISMIITLQHGARNIQEQSLVALDVPHPQPPVFIAGDEPAGSIVPSFNESGRVQVKTNLSRPATIVLSEVDYPGWRAQVDGQTVPLTRFADTFLAVPVTAGTHTVEWDYHPLSFAIGLSFSLLTLGGLGLFSFFSKMRRR